MRAQLNMHSWARHRYIAGPTEPRQILTDFDRKEHLLRGKSMDRKFSPRLSRAIYWRVATVLMAVCVGASGASARVTTLTINDTQPAFGGASFGSVGTYEVITGTFTDEVDPSDPHNAVIVDIEHGPKNANGTVSL
jgi:hypothetical protein